MIPFGLILHVLLVLTVVYVCAKFEVSSFIGDDDIRGSQNSKKCSRESHMTHFDILLHFLFVLFAVHLL